MTTANKASLFKVKLLALVKMCFLDQTCSLNHFANIHVKNYMYMYMYGYNNI